MRNKLNKIAMANAIRPLQAAGFGTAITFTSRPSGSGPGKSIVFLVLLLVLIGTSNLVYALDQKDFYGVWTNKNRDQFYEINKDFINLAMPDKGDFSKTQFRIAKWEKIKWQNNDGYTIYLSTEDGRKITETVILDAYSDLYFIVTNTYINPRTNLPEKPIYIKSAEWKKSSAAELNKAKAAAKAEDERIASQQGSFTDSRDSKKYKTVKIGKQAWMAENLNYNESGSKCYENKPANCDKYGRLYDWETAKKACPKGWHLPSDDEWGILMQAVNPECSKNEGCSEAGKKLKANNGWNSLNDRTSGNGTDEFGFSALPGGNSNPRGDFRDVDKKGNWWSSTKYDYDAADAWSRDIYHNFASVYRGHNNKYLLVSVRCLQD
jgi:uncharacterized protein (TIGR02145 family)